jgi:peroxiredoxin Q/BCP
MKPIVTCTLVLFLLIPGARLDGQNIKEIKLNSVTDNHQFSLQEATGKFVALHFLLKTECPVCIRHTQEYFNNADRLPDVVQVFIKPDTKEEIKEWAKGLTSDELDMLPIYRDPGAKLAKRLKIPDGYEFHNQVVHYPALVLINPDGEEVFRYIGKNNRDRYSFTELESKIQELTR